MDGSRSSSRKRSSRQKEYDYFLKVVIIGRCAVGKSSLMMRFTDEKFSDSYVNTIGVDFRFRTVEVCGKKVKIQIWDTAGQEKFRTITSTYYRGADAILLIYDITNAASLEDIETFWIKEVEKHGSDVPFLLLVGNKTDLEKQRKVPVFDPPVHLFKLGCAKIQAHSCEVSAKTNEGVSEVFLGLATEYIKKKEAKRAGRSYVAGHLMKQVPLSEIKEMEEEDSGSRSSGGERKEERVNREIKLTQAIQTSQKKAPDGDCQC